MGGDLERTRPGGRDGAQGGIAMPLEFPASLDTDLEGVHDYLPIAEHGVIGDQRSVALVGTNGTIDWYCPERFDGPSVFAAILDRRRGGFYRIAPANPEAQAKQLYLPETNVLITRFLSPQGVAEIQDFMPLGGERQRPIRRVVGVRGRLHFRLDLEPRFAYGRLRPTVEQAAERVVFRAPGRAFAFAVPAALSLEPTPAGVSAEFDVEAGESRTFALESGERATPIGEQEAEALMHETARAWRAWLGHSTYFGRWREMVHRSALTLRIFPSTCATSTAEPRTSPARVQIYFARRAQRAANSSQRRRERGTPMRRKPSRKALVIGGGPHMYTQTSARWRPAAAFSAVRKPSRSATTTCGTKVGCSFPACSISSR
jgi:hypothetical protein